MSANVSIERLDAARRELARCTDLGDIKRIRDQALAMQSYARAQGLSADLQAKAASIRIEAEARMGELERQRVPETGGRPAKPAPRGTGFSPKERRRFRALARVPEAEREALKVQLGPDATPTALLRLARGAEKRQRAEDVRDRVADGPAVIASLDRAIELGLKFGTVYADPPWAYGNQGTRAATGNHYPTMTVEEIAAHQVSKVLADEAHLHLWTTNAFLFEAKAVIEAWGFEYRSCFVWVKPQMGIGNYWRVSHEFLLLGVKGRRSFRDKALMSWARLDRDEHSVKPKPVRLMVERASPGPYLELFGREQVDGWTVFGNEAVSGQRELVGIEKAV
jgi:N6-adenosine-specific RNA methylase IME4